MNQLAAKMTGNDKQMISQLLKEQESFKMTASPPPQKNGILLMKPFNKWLEEAKETEAAKMLFSEFWHEGEVCILFADSNLGKSLLAVQIADSISKGEPIKGFKLEAEKQPILYFDFELTKKQVEVRYSEKDANSRTYQNHYLFDKNFERIEIDPDSDIPNDSDFEQLLNDSIEQCIIAKGAKILIIDNITFLKNETEKAKNATPLMAYLKKLKNKYSLSILVLSHTPKRDLSKPITQNDINGSKMVFNFIDSCFAIGQSTSDNSIRYIKQVKARNTPIIYDSENVVVCSLVKYSNFVEFEYLNNGAEREHLKQASDKDRQSLIEQVKQLANEGKSQRQIAAELSLALGTVNKYLKTN